MNTKVVNEIERERRMMMQLFSLLKRGLAHVFPQNICT